MLNWSDKDAAERLAAQLRELLRDRTMTFDQLASCYSIQHGQSVTQRLKEMSRNGRLLSLGDFVLQMSDFFEVAGQSQVRARASPWAAAPAPAAADCFRGARGNTAPSSPTQPAAACGHDASPTSQEEPVAAAPPMVMKYSDVSRGVQNILKEQHEPITVEQLDAIFVQKFGMSVSDIVGMSTGEYLTRKDNIFDWDPARGTVFLQSAILSGPPMADPAAVRDEAFVVREFEQLVEAMGPVVYISTLCGKFIQRNGISVSSVISTRPLDLFKRHPGVFLIVGQGNVTLKKYERMPDVQRLVDKPSSKAQRIVKASEEAQLPVPGLITEQHVVDEFRRLILTDGTDSVYISSLCGRFLQRFKKPVTAIISCKPAEFLRRYPEVFVMTGGGNVGLREVLGPDAVSVPPPPPRVPKAVREEDQGAAADEEVSPNVAVDEESYTAPAHLDGEPAYQVVMQRLMTVCRQIELASFLALDEVVLGGAEGKELLTAPFAAKIVLFVRQLPYANFPQWLPHILDTLSHVLEHQLAALRAERFKVEKDHLRFCLRGGVPSSGGAPANNLHIQIYLSPVFRSSDHLFECIKAASDDERPYFHPALVKEGNDYIGRQPHHVKVFANLESTKVWADDPGGALYLQEAAKWLLQPTSEEGNFDEGGEEFEPQHFQHAGDDDDDDAFQDALEGSDEGP